MDSDAIYLPDDEARVPHEDLSALLAEGTSASVAELCANGPSATLLFGCMLLAAAALIAAIRLAWHIYAADIGEFCRQADCTGGDPAATAPAGNRGVMAGRSRNAAVAAADDATSESTTARSGPSSKAAARADQGAAAGVPPLSLQQSADVEREADLGGAAAAAPQQMLGAAATGGTGCR